MDAFQQEAESFRRTIVIVEDDPANAEMLALLLQTERSYRVLKFREGAEVFADLNTIREKRPALFILDYQLSGMTGSDLYERLQAVEGLKKIPALVVSATSINEEQKKRLHQLGLLFIQKPYNIDDFLTIVDQFTAGCPL